MTQHEPAGVGAAGAFGTAEDGKGNSESRTESTLPVEGQFGSAFRPHTEEVGKAIESFSAGGCVVSDVSWRGVVGVCFAQLRRRKVAATVAFKTKT